MAELSVEDVQEPAPQLEATAPEPEEPADVPVGTELPVGAELPEADVSAEIAAPQKRGRPPGSKKQKGSAEAPAPRADAGVVRATRAAATN